MHAHPNTRLWKSITRPCLMSFETLSMSHLIKKNWYAYNEIINS